MDKRFKVLVVDDDAINVQLILATLKNEYDIFTALNGYSAIALLADHTPDLILLDVMMPDLDGFEVCRIIRAEERYADIPVIFLTALDTQEGALRGLDTGAIDYLTKPVNFDLLKLRVRNHLALKERNEQIREQRALLERQKEEYQTLFREMLDAFALHEMIWDEEGNARDYRYLAVNPAFERITGLKEDAVIGRTVLELLPETEPEWIETFAKVARTGETALWENYSAALHKYFEVKAFRPAPNQFACMFVDITERKKIEETQLFLLQAAYLGTGEDFFQSLARYLAQALAMDFVCIDRLLGDNLTARTLAIYSDGKFVDNLDYALQDTPCGEVLSKELCIYPHDVRQRFPTDLILQELSAESYIGITLWNSDGKPIGLLAMIARKPMENQHLAESILKLVSLRAAGELERKLADEEKEVLQKQFQQAQKLESLGVLVGGVAHDFNNILAMIMGSCFLGQKDPVSSGEHFTRIETAAQRGAELCRQMLAYAGKAQFSPGQVNIGLLIDDLMQLMKASLHKNVTMTVDVASDLPCVVGDNSQISQVIMNLVINAAEAIGDVPGEIRVRLKKIRFSSAAPQKDHLGQKIPAGSYVCLEVADTGCGMSEEVMRRLFEPFYTTKFTGRGLGMSATLGIINGHKGALQLVSQPGQGTTFTVYLPADSKEAVSEPCQEKIDAPWRGGGTILLVDDEEAILLAVSAMLKILGFTVIKATDGREALQLFQEHAATIDLVLTDMGMPVMSGQEMIPELRKIKSDLPIIVSSGFGENDVIAGINAGEVAAVLNKPYKFDALRQVLQQVMGAVDQEVPSPPCGGGLGWGVKCSGVPRS